MSLLTDLRPGTCEIIGRPGDGGGAEFYRARDTKPQRDVALTDLPEALQ